MNSSFRDWKEILPELVDLIVTKIDRFADYIRFCGVCPQWRKVALASDNGHKQSLFLLKTSRKKLPMLMFKTTEHNNDERGLFSVSDGTTHNVKLPQSCKNRLFGSCHGWLMYFEENQSITLMNPLNNSCISLPKFEGCCYAHWINVRPGYYIVKGILSADPRLSPNNYTVAVIYNVGSGKLGVYNSGDMHWRFFDLRMYDNFQFIDIAFHKGNLYGCDQNSRLVQIDISSQCIKSMVHIKDYADVNYLIESQGDLLLVQRFWSILDKIDNKFSAETEDFKIFKLVNEEDSPKWVQIFDVGEQALFVGVNYSVSVSTVEFPGCLSSSIYYTPQLYLVFSFVRCRPDNDMGIFRLEDKSFHSHHILDTFEGYVEPPIWFVPS